MTSDKANGIRTLGALLVSPYRAFVMATESPNLAIPFGLAMLASLGIFAVVLPASLSQLGSVQGSTQVSTGIAVATGTIVALVTPWLAAFVSALALAGASMISGGTLEFRTHLSVAGYARIPLVVQGVVLAMMSLKLLSIQEAQNLTLSLAVLVPSGSPFVRGLLSAVGPFEVWHFYLLTCGLAAVLRTRPTRVWWFGCIMFGLKLMLSVAATLVA